ncbi:MAG: efflux RND transporter periplasmic adaptor subunit [Bacteroidota bacterium]
MKPIFNLLIYSFIALILAACGSQQAESLESKKAELKKLKTQLVSLNSQIEKLETEIQKEDPEQIREARKIPVVIEPLSTQEFSHYLKVQGQVEANKNILISPKTAGNIEAIYVKEGQSVSKNKTLAKIDNAVLQRSIEEVNTQLELAKTLYQKQKNLWDQEIGTEVQYLTAKNQMDLLKKRLGTLKEQAAMAMVYAPFAGVVDEIFPKVGESTGPGMPFFRIVNTSDLSLAVQLSEAYIPHVKRGDEVKIYFPALDEEITARISSVGQSIDPNKRTFEIEVKLPPRARYKANMFGEVSIRDQQRDEALVLPVNIVQRSEKGPFVYIAQKGEGEQWLAARKLIETGLSYNGEIEVVSGLEAGEQIITTGYKNLSDGTELILQ